MKNNLLLIAIFTIASCTSVDQNYNSDFSDSSRNAYENEKKEFLDSLNDVEENKRLQDSSKAAIAIQMKMNAHFDPTAK